MTASQFTAECHIRAIHPAIAIENDSIVRALKAKDDELVIKLLNTEF